MPVSRSKSKFVVGKRLSVAALALVAFAFSPAITVDPAHADGRFAKSSARSGVVLGGSARAKRVGTSSRIQTRNARSSSFRSKGRIDGGDIRFLERKRLREARNQAIRQQELIEKQIRRGGDASGLFIGSTIDSGSVVRDVFLGRTGVIDGGDLRFLERKRLLEERNQAIRQQELIEKQIRRDADASFTGSGSSGGFAGTRSSVVAGGIGSGGTACPAKHNCGFRIYEDGTGPRIITPGVSGDGLPAFDGVSGPRIITLGN